MANTHLIFLNLTKKTVDFYQIHYYKNTASVCDIVRIKKQNGRHSPPQVRCHDLMEQTNLTENSTALKTIVKAIQVKLNRRPAYRGTSNK